MGRLKRGARTRPVSKPLTLGDLNLVFADFAQSMRKLGDLFAEGMQTGLVAREPIAIGDPLYVQPSFGTLGMSAAGLSASAIVPTHVARIMQEQVLAAADDKINATYRTQAEDIFARYANPRPGRRIYIDGKDITEEITSFDFRQGPLKRW